MRNAHGYLRIEGGPEGLVEEDTVKCNHCQATGFVQRGGKVLWPQLHAKPQDQFTCRQCYMPICPSCANHSCRHFEKWLEQMERQGGTIRLNLERLEEIAYKAMHALGL